MRALIGIVAGIFIVQAIWIIEGHTRNSQYLFGMLELATGLSIAYIAIEFRQIRNPNWRQRRLKSLKGYLAR